MASTDRHFDTGGVAYSQHGLPSVTFYTFGDARQTSYIPIPWPANVVPTSEADAIVSLSRKAQPRVVHTFDKQTGRTSIQSLQVTKQLGGASGQWTVTLKGTVQPYDVTDNPALFRKDWIDVLSDGDWAVIDVLLNGEKRTLMIGRIDSIRTNIGAGGDGAVTATTTVSGRDVGAVYEDVPVYFNPYDPNHANPAGIKVAEMLGPEAVLEGPPGEVVKTVLTKFAANGPYGQQPDVPGGIFSVKPTPTPFVDIVSDNVQETRGSVFAASILTTTSAGSLWDFASGFVVPQINEMIVDTRPSETNALDRSIYLTIRERPFVNLADKDKSPWFSLQPIPVRLSEVQSINVSKGRNRVNQIQVLTQLLSGIGQDAANLFPPVFNLADAKRFGLRRLEYRTQYSFGVSNADTTNPAKLRNLITQWNVLNPYYYSGLITLARLRSDIRVGTKIVMLDGPIPHTNIIPEAKGVNLATKDCGSALTFYVEAVQYAFQGGESPSSQTQIMVSRGYVESDRVNDILVTAGRWADPTGIPPITNGENGAGLEDLYDLNDVIDDGTRIV